MDLTPLTPNHFLQEQLGGRFAPNNVYTGTFNPTKRWRGVQEFVCYFWHRWLHEWIPCLSARSKRPMDQVDLKIRDSHRLRWEGLWKCTPERIAKCAYRRFRLKDKKFAKRWVRYALTRTRNINWNNLTIVMLCDVSRSIISGQSRVSKSIRVSSLIELRKADAIAELVAKESKLNTPR